MDVVINGKVVDTVFDHFRESLWENRSRFIVESGGAGSGKSHAICQRVCYLFMTIPNINIGVVRATMPALVRSVYLNGIPSIVHTLRGWGVPVDAWLNKSNSTIYNPLNNSTIQFFGLQDPDRIKSANFHYVWMEEATELNVNAWSQLNTRLRLTNKVWPAQMFISYNPVSYYNWAVQTFVVSPMEGIKDDIHVNFTSFVQNPYIPKEVYQSWLAFAEQDEAYYRTFITGHPGMPMGRIYPNIKFLPIEFWPEDVRKLNGVKPYYGVDWGYIDPMVLVECYNYKDAIYTRCIYHETHKDADDLIKFMDDEGIPKSATMYCDSASPERIRRLIDAGYYNVRKAYKDIDAGLSHLRTKKIYACNANKEGLAFVNEVAGYVYAKDPNDSSKFIEQPERNVPDHILDALRYAIDTNDRDGTFMVGSMQIPSTTSNIEMELKELREYGELGKKEYKKFESKKSWI